MRLRFDSAAFCCFRPVTATAPGCSSTRPSSSSSSTMDEIWKEFVVGVKFDFFSENYFWVFIRFIRHISITFEWTALSLSRSPSAASNTQTKMPHFLLSPLPLPLSHTHKHTLTTNSPIYYSHEIVLSSSLRKHVFSDILWYGLAIAALHIQWSIFFLIFSQCANSLGKRKID